MSEKTDKDNAAAPFQELAQHMGSMPVAPAHGIAAIALSLAMKYHDIGTVQDGTMYQQLKLEGKNLQPLTLDAVLETAAQMEAWLLASNERIAALVVDAIASGAEEHSEAVKP